MSETTSKPIKFTHYDDCVSTGCPGHEMTCTDTTSGYLTFRVDGEVVDSFSDPEVFTTAYQAFQSITNRRSIKAKKK